MAQSDGELFWWISQGRAEGAMPAFADALTEVERWDLINFLRAQAAGVRASVLTDEVTAGPGLLAPDFAFENAHGLQETLRGQRGEDPVLLVFFALPASRDRLQQLYRDESHLARAGVRVLAISLDDSAGSEGHDDEHLTTLPFVVRVSSDVLKTYALFEPKSRMGASPADHRHMEILIDRAGYMRALWSLEENSRWASISNVLEQVRRLERLRTGPPVESGHAH